MRRKPEGANVSQHNFAPEITKNEDIRMPLIISDTTMREGEQAADVVFSIEEKINLCSMLVDLGIPQVQLHAKRDSKTIEKLKNRFPTVKIEALVTGIAKDWKDQVKMAADAGSDIIEIVYRVSDLQLKHGLNLTYEEMVENVRERIAFARGSRPSHPPEVAFSSSDATRTDIDKLVRVVKVAVGEGAHVVSFPDTVGVMRPRAYAWLVSQVRNEISDKVLIGVHCHNDFGLGLANSFAAMEAGAQIFDVCVNGLGERAGGVSIDEFLVGLWALYGIDLGVKLQGLAALSEYIAKVSGVPIPVSKPIVGTNAFAQKGEVHVAAVRKASFLFEAFDPDVVGAKRVLRYGVGSGIATLEEKLRQIGLDVSSIEVTELQRRLEEEVRVKKKNITDDELRTFASEYIHKK